MPAFSALESRLATVTLSRLANVTVTIDGAAVEGVFDAGRKESFSGLVAGTLPTLTLPAGVALARNTALTINGVGYLVAHIETVSGQQVASLEETD